MRSRPAEPWACPKVKTHYLRLEFDVIQPMISEVKAGDPDLPVWVLQVRTLRSQCLERSGDSGPEFSDLGAGLDDDRLRQSELDG